MRKIFWLVWLVLSSLVVPASAHHQPAFTEKLRIGRGAVLDAEWHPNGQLILVDTIIGAWLYDAGLNDVAYLPDARLGAFSPDGRLIAGADANHNVTLWQAAPPFAPAASLPGHSHYLTALQWSPDGTRLASLDRDGLLLIWDAATRQVLHRLQMNGADEIAWSRGGSYLAASNGDTIQVWNRTGEVVFTNYSQYDAVISPMWRDDTQLLYLLCQGAGCDSQLWDAKTKKMIFERGLGPFDPQFNPDGSLIANGNASGLWIKNTDSGEIVHALDLEPLNKQGGVTAWSADGQYAAFGEFGWRPDKRATLWVMDAKNGKIVAEFPNQTLSVKGIYWSPDNNTLLTVDAANQLFLLEVDGNFDKTNFFRLKNTFAHTTVGMAADWKSDSTSIAAADTLGNVVVWNTDGIELLRLEANFYAVNALAWQPGGNLLALHYSYPSLDTDNNIYVWDTITDAEYHRPVMTIPHTDFVLDMVWSPDGKMLASTQREQPIHLWDVERPNVIQNVYASANDFYGTWLIKVGWSHDSKYMVFAYYSGAPLTDVGIIDLATGQLFRGNPENWSGGSWVWTAEGDYLWAGSKTNECDDSGSPEEVRLIRGYSEEVEMQPLCLTGSPEAVSKLVFSPDARLLAGYNVSDWWVGGAGAVWDIQTGQKRLSLAHVVNVIWSPDGAYLTVFHGDNPGTVAIMDVASGLSVFSADIKLTDSDGGQVVWSPDSQQFALLDQGVMFIYERNE